LADDILAVLFDLQATVGLHAEEQPRTLLMLTAADVAMDLTPAEGLFTRTLAALPIPFATVVCLGAAFHSAAGKDREGWLMRAIGQLGRVSGNIRQHVSASCWSHFLGHYRALQESRRFVADAVGLFTPVGSREIIHYRVLQGLQQALAAAAAERPVVDFDNSSWGPADRAAARGVIELMRRVEASCHDLGAAEALFDEALVLWNTISTPARGDVGLNSAHPHLTDVLHAACMELCRPETAPGREEDLEKRMGRFVAMICRLGAAHGIEVVLIGVRAVLPALVRLGAAREQAARLLEGVQASPGLKEISVSAHDVLWRTRLAIIGKQAGMMLLGGVLMSGLLGGCVTGLALVVWCFREAPILSFSLIGGLIVSAAVAYRAWKAWFGRT
jgi:hypothetical protein